MSFFGLGGGNSNTPQLSSEQKITAAENELDMVTTMFNSLLDSCYRKCFDKNYDNGDLTKNESLCIDRCVVKYFAANVKVGESMQELGKSGSLGRPTQ
ncbi:protein transporter tim10 [Brettanomyces nanus]|uniref:Mitochondrial import inner membrane translocase subunit n=1 Tax=Eeniella nana TaxID=13502 RepID=A0A875S164_EENNA|nr:protein transporter tim10 [Brettanomyces nanus]QPG73599.1 protein transporter tim10 [Brettanomyces nanus]